MSEYVYDASEPVWIKDQRVWGVLIYRDKRGWRLLLARLLRRPLADAVWVNMKPAPEGAGFVLSWNAAGIFSVPEAPHDQD